MGVYNKIRIRSDRFCQTIYIYPDNMPAEWKGVVGEAVHYLKNKGFNVVGQGETKDDYILMVDTKGSDGIFKPLKHTQ